MNFVDEIKILIVEDENIIALNIKKKLKSFGYAVLPLQRW